MANWSDLGPRVGSAAVMSVLGIGAIWLGGNIFLGLVLIVTALMAWEIFEMCEMQPERGRVSMPVAVSCVLFLCLFSAGTISWLAVLASVVLVVGCGFALTKERIYGALVLFAVFWVGFGLVAFREEQGLDMLLWLILVVIASDVMGYFAGKTFGGPKFWPSISPKKTWSGTAVGWIGAALVGLGFVIWNGSPLGLILLSVLVAFAGQMGDIVESALKRKTGVKDSSNLIPGHGGVLDRFDAISGAVIFLLALSLVIQVSV
ncbi:phosphatidate cytidylyltransferase [Octadecabacter ascidiaceicola]|uniref:Phosphatidate cytidylyltransferase n=1 Tax=Octadecabacter ascidiaceicola TaxID=1655543 RepID=A0A238JK70_9RHOB|nr:phosphatidate cytidylyltransferase [Octadecabacter ascidiaceicola]SMX31059.1 Phosphatidate cytidylyltransferase [Octadecabacter ascidiaceicola]